MEDTSTSVIAAAEHSSDRSSCPSATELTLCVNSQSLRALGYFGTTVFTIIVKSTKQTQRIDIAIPIHAILSVEHNDNEPLDQFILLV
jgi:hypothetical protein